MGFKKSKTLSNSEMEAIHLRKEKAQKAEALKDSGTGQFPVVGPICDVQPGVKTDEVAGGCFDIADWKGGRPHQGPDIVRTPQVPGQPWSPKRGRR